MELTPDNTIRRRAATLDSVQRRDARDFVRPYQSRVGDWNAELAYLRAAKQARKMDVSARAAAASNAVAASQQQLRHEMLASTTASHSIINDMVRALARLESSFGELRSN